MTTSHPDNRLAKETSPYLLQHAKNPVDWYPWGPEALERAKKEDKPIFLSIGYSACHWCHVMEHESFEDAEVAAKLSESFIAIKVDREERPDIDALYMAATIAMSGGGGWPMSVFLTPDGKPFFAGTYFPKTSAHGRPGFLDVLERIAVMWKDERSELLDQAGELVGAVEAESAPDAPRPVDARVEEAAADQLLRTFDSEWGGFGGAPKFPAPFALSLLLRRYDKTGYTKILDAVTTTLDRMARGGIYDQVGGGFARYSTDERWLAPHFEKMLYDNAQLARVYVEAYQVTKDERHKRTAVDTLDYILREMQGEHGGYFCATDADSEGEEGKFFVWSYEEIESLLDADDAAAVIAAYDVRPRGNWEGKNILWLPLELSDVAPELSIKVPELEKRLERARKTLYEAREKRVHPSLDDKVLVSWNALMIGTMAFAGRVLGEPRFRESAERAANMVLTQMRTPERGLFRTFRNGRAHIEGFLEDYAFLADALVDLYEANGDPPTLREALRLAERASLAFRDDSTAAFSTTATHHEALVVRTRESTDNAMPSANAILARALTRLAVHFGRDDLRVLAEGAIRAHGKAIARMPKAFATSLDVASRLIEPPVEVVLVGTPGDPAYDALDRALASRYLANVAIARLDPAREARGEPIADAFPLLTGKTLVGGKAAAYVCRNFACQAPVTSPHDLLRDIEVGRARSRSESATSLAIPVHGLSATADATARLLRSANVEGRDLFGVQVNPVGTLVASYRENDAQDVTTLALEAGRNVIAVDPQRASAVGDALDMAVRTTGAQREAFFVVGILPAAEPWSEAVKAVRTIAAEARLARLDAALIPWTPETADAVAETLAHVAKSDLALSLGVLANEALDDAGAKLLLSKLPVSVKIVAAPFNLLEGDASVPHAVAATGRAFFALRPLDIAVKAGDRTRLAQLAGAPAKPGQLPDAKALAPALAALAAIEAEYREKVAVHLQVQGDVDLDPNDLLTWSVELGRAEVALDDLLEVEAFVAQSVTPALGAQMNALSSIGGPLEEIVSSIRDRYLEAIDGGIKALARRVASRQSALVETLSKAVGAPADLSATTLGAITQTPGVTAALVTCRTVGHASGSAKLEKIEPAQAADLIGRARAGMPRAT